jgi:hypothetical protein
VHVYAQALLQKLNLYNRARSTWKVCNIIMILPVTKVMCSVGDRAVNDYGIGGMISSSVICQTTGPQPLPKRFLHLMRYRASSFK